MNSKYNLERFLEAQESSYPMALAEIKDGEKMSHWMWYIFPQINGLGASQKSRYFAIKDLNEAIEYLQHPILGKRLIEISNELLKLDSDNAYEIFGTPDDLKLKSCMTLFSELENSNPVFQLVLEKYFNCEKDSLTIDLINSF